MSDVPPVAAHYAAPPAQPRPQLRKAIRCRSSNKFLTSDGGWTDDVCQAAHFPTIAAVQAAIAKHHLRDVQAYFAFGPFDEGRDAAYDFSIDLKSQT